MSGSGEIVAYDEEGTPPVSDWPPAPGPLPWASRSSMASSIRIAPGGVSGTALRTVHRLSARSCIGSSRGVPQAYCPKEDPGMRSDWPSSDRSSNQLAAECQ